MPGRTPDRCGARATRTRRSPLSRAGRASSTHFWSRGRDCGLADVELPLCADLAATPLEIEIGFGSGRFLLEEAARNPDRRYLGIESAAEYYGATRARAVARNLGNVTLACGEALYLISTCLAPRSAAAVHVYFPDPWPKRPHRRRRLLNADNVDAVVGLLRGGGVLFFASDHQEYAGSVRRILAALDGTSLRELDGPWPGGPRTQYESRYAAAGRPIVRLELTKVE